MQNFVFSVSYQCQATEAFSVNPTNWPPEAVQYGKGLGPLPNALVSPVPFTLLTIGFIWATMKNSVPLETIPAPKTKGDKLQVRNFKRCSCHIAYKNTYQLEK